MCVEYEYVYALVNLPQTQHVHELDLFMMINSESEFVSFRLIIFFLFCVFISVCRLQFGNSSFY